MGQSGWSQRLGSISDFPHQGPQPQTLNDLPREELVFWRLLPHPHPSPTVRCAGIRVPALEEAARSEHPWHLGALQCRKAKNFILLYSSFHTLIRLRKYMRVCVCDFYQNPHAEETI